MTEAGYLRGADGGLDADRPEVQADLEALRRDPTALVRTTPARLLAGLAARRRADAGPLALVPCDNVPGNGADRARASSRDARRAGRPGPGRWLDGVRVVPDDDGRPHHAAHDPEDVRAVRAATGRDDRVPVVTEPFSEWVLSGAFPAGRPRWEDAGATFTDDVTPFEHRKLWLLNGAHSLLAYAGSIRGHTTVAEAVADDVVPRLARAVVVGGVARIWTSPPTTSRRTAPRCSSASRTRACRTGSTGSPRTARRSCRSGSCPCCAPSARGADARRRRARAGGLGLPPARRRRAGQRRARRRGRAARDGPLAEAVPRVLEHLAPGSAPTTSSWRACVTPSDDHAEHGVFSLGHAGRRRSSGATGTLMARRRPSIRSPKHTPAPSRVKSGLSLPGLVRSRDDRRADQRRNRVQVVPQDRRHLVEQDVAQHAPADACDRTENRRLDRPETVAERRGRARDAEHREPDRVEHLDIVDLCARSRDG